MSGVLPQPSLLSYTAQLYSERGYPRAATITDHLRGSGLPCGPIAPPSVFQGPHFMTSEYNSKYLKEPSQEPGGCLSEFMPPSHHTSLLPT